MKSTNKVTEFFRCDCHSPEHQFVIDYWTDDKPEEAELYISIHLTPLYPWYKRAWLAVKYAFGYTSSLGHFQEVVLRQPEVKRLITVLQRRHNTGKK